MEWFTETPLNIILYLGNMFLFLSVFLYLVYVVQVQGFKSRSRKYKFVSEREGHAMMGVVILFSISMGFYAMILLDLTIGQPNAGFLFLSALFGIGVAFTLGSVSTKYLKRYHPFILEKRLIDIRFGERWSPITGQPMKLLNEKQENVHLTDQMIEEEKSLSVDYDVWVDESSDHKIIERYDTRYHALICNACNFRTLMERKEEIIKKPEEHEQGVLRKTYECSHCGYTETKDATIPSWTEERKFNAKSQKNTALEQV